MQFVIVAALSGTVASLNVAPLCYPPKCEIDENCADSIHGANAKCCGGQCVSTFPSDRLVGEPCMATTAGSNGVNYYESCGGYCSSGLYCGDDRRCHALRGPGCNCTTSTQCAPYPGQPTPAPCAYSNQPTNYTVCRGQNLPGGAACVLSTECGSGNCTNFQCVTLPDGSLCGSDPQCTSPSICKQNASGSSYYCLPPCATGSTCCFRATDCAGARVTSGPSATQCLMSGGNGTCIAAPALGEGCAGNCFNQSLICAPTCNGTLGLECSTGSTCQAPHSFAIGAFCYPGSAAVPQCPKNASCLQLNSSVSATCVGLGSVPTGGACGTSGAYTAAVCQPGSVCGPDPSYLSNYICKLNMSVQIGMPCNLYAPTNSPAECVSGTQCLYNTTSGPYCLPPLPVGANCTNMFSSQYQGCQNSTSLCIAQPGSLGLTFGCTDLTFGCQCMPPNVLPAGANCSADAQCMNGGICRQLVTNGPTVCVALQTQANGMQCNYTQQCKDQYAFCNTTNYTCTSNVGKPCAYVGDCGAATLWDCSCSRRCYILNPPTPVPAPTPVPPNPCQAKINAFIDAYPPAYNIGSSNSLMITTVQGLLNLATGLQGLQPNIFSLGVDLLCCETCTAGSYTSRFDSPIYMGYQVNCATKNISLLTQDSCNDKKAQLAFVNCWPTSSAPTLSLGFGLLLAFLPLMF